MSPSRPRLNCRALGGLAFLLCPVVLVVAGQSVVVSQSGRAFSVSTLQIKRGDTVRFENKDVFDHQVYVNSPGFKFESQEQAPGTSVDLQFPVAGMFDVQCEIHPRMHLSVTVN